MRDATSRRKRRSLLQLAVVAGIGLATVSAPRPAAAFCAFLDAGINGATGAVAGALSVPAVQANSEIRVDIGIGAATVALGTSYPSIKGDMLLSVQGRWGRHGYQLDASSLSGCGSVLRWNSTASYTYSAVSTSNHYLQVEFGGGYEFFGSPTYQGWATRAGAEYEYEVGRSIRLGTQLHYTAAWDNGVRLGREARTSTTAPLVHRVEAAGRIQRKGKKTLQPYLRLAAGWQVAPAHRGIPPINGPFVGLYIGVESRFDQLR